MRIWVFLSSLVLLSIFISCKEERDGMDKLLAGMIGGEPWTFQYAKANLNSVDNIFDVELYGTQQTQDDPCTIINTANTHLTIQIPNQVGNYNLPFPIQAQSLAFQQAGVNTTRFYATSGFIEISAISGLRVVGYLQAVFDEDNTVEGTFVFDRCN